VSAVEKREMEVRHQLEAGETVFGLRYLEEIEEDETEIRACTCTGCPDESLDRRRFD